MPKNDWKGGNEVSGQEKDIKDAAMEKDVSDILQEDIVDDLNEELNEDSVVSEDLDETDNISQVENEAEKGEKKSKSFFKKDKGKDKKDEKIEELTDRLMRSMAEFENFRKRSEKEKAQMFEVGASDIVKRILPVVDNFERGLNSISEEEKSTAFAQGIEKIYKQLVTSLEEAGVKAIEAVGKEFDPNLHNAVMHGEDENFGENIIAEEFQKGYIYRETVVRYSMVKVVN